MLPSISSFCHVTGFDQPFFSDQFIQNLFSMVTLLPSGPWLVGEVLDNSYGVVTLYGIYVNNTFIGDKFAMYFFIKDVSIEIFCYRNVFISHYEEGSFNSR